MQPRSRIPCHGWSETGAAVKSYQPKFCTAPGPSGSENIKTGNRILRAGTSAEGCRGIPRNGGEGGGATMGGDAHRSPPPAILWFLSHRWERNSPSRAKPCETARRVVAPYGCYGLRGMGGSGDQPLRRIPPARQIIQGNTVKISDSDQSRQLRLPFTTFIILIGSVSNLHLLRSSCLR